MKNMILRGGVSAIALAMAAGTAYAQDVESVTVTGVRAAVDSALGIKKNATQIMDSIVAEDIGKLPDNTVVESLQHVTGVAIIRNSYEPSTVLIRGLPDVQTLLNGRQVFTATGRTISLPDFPSQLLSRVDVHKASSATDLTGGIAGLIDVHLHRPFDFDGFVLAAGAQATYPTLNGVPYGQLSALISDRWKTDIGEIGLLLDVSYNGERDRVDNVHPHAGTKSISAAPIAGATNGPFTSCAHPAGSLGTCATTNITYTGGVAAGYAGLYGGSAFQQYGKNERAALNFATQWRPTDTVEVFAEGFYSRLRNVVTADYFVGQTLACNNASRTTVFPGTNIGNEAYNGCFGLTSDQPRHAKEDTYQIASGASWDVTDHFKVTTEFSATVSRSTATTAVLDSYYNYNEADGFHTVLSPGGSGGLLIDIPGNEEVNGPFYYSQLYDNFNDSRGSAWDGRVDGTYTFGPGSFISAIEFGYRSARRNVNQRSPAGGGLGCAAITSAGNPQAANSKYYLDAYYSPACTQFRADTTIQPVPGGPLTNVGAVNAANKPLSQTSVHIGGDMVPTAGLHCTHGSLFDGEFGMTKFCDASQQFLYYGIENLRHQFGYSGQPEFSPATSYIASEMSKESYLKVDYAFDVYGFPVDGNFGARMVDTLLTIHSYTSQYVPLNVTVPTATAAQVKACTTCINYSPLTAVKESNDLMPSLNMRVTLADNLFFRFSASRTVTRPTFGQLNPNLKLTAPTGNSTGSITGGNANLNSVKSTNLDADLEYYWGHGNHISAAVFHRDVQGYIQSSTVGVTVDGVYYNQTTSLNLQNAPIEGVEAGYSQFLDFLPGFWSGFGWDINGTYVAGTFFNISHWHSNVSGIYEKGPYSVRVSWTWSSNYVSGNSTGPQPQFLYDAPRNNLDASFNYSWNDRVTFTLDATNISNSRNREFWSQPGDNREQDMNYYAAALNQYDRTISIGVRYRM